jgi:signal peptidase I
MTARALIAWVAATLGVVSAGLVLAAEHLVMPWVVVGRSMEPTLHRGDRVLVDCWTYRHRRPRVGEIALLLAPSNLPLVKRVASRPTLDDRVRVVGDNAANSVDSRQFGAVPSGRFRGRIVFRYWPLSRAGPLARRPHGGRAPRRAGRPTESERQ